MLSGPSGVGKGSVMAVVRARHPEAWLSVSWTTRPPRPGEVDGQHYHFVDEHTFDAAADAGGFLEHARYAGYAYGTPLQPVVDRIAAGQTALLEIDLQGARQVRSRLPEAVLVFLAPPSFEELSRRLTGRGTERPDVIARRLAVARQEMAAEAEFDVTIVNDDVSTACAELVELLRFGTPAGA